jgi:C2H2 transcription facotor
MLTARKDTNRNRTMEGAYTMSAPLPGQQYYFYNPETEPRQFVVPHPEMPPYHAPMPIYPQQQPVFATHPQLAPKLPMHSQMSLTPIASPQPTHMKPSIMIQQQNGSPALMPLDTRFDFYGFPSTPPLSSAGSSISSPPSTCGMIHTPVNGSFTLETMEGVKEGCESEVQAEILAKPDWSRSDSPPLTPGMFSIIKFYLWISLKSNKIIYSDFMLKECFECSISGN